ncbi:hypothetical protein GALL_527940 [mine drainage metagenome]|uniref:Uncharacterized protein n=1 Tax=mine drainage metagenome TaxID=410659 RepID=A0A1J5P4K0_9ZZZZ
MATFDGLGHGIEVAGAVFTLVLDRQNCYGIKRWFKMIQGQIAAGTEVDHQLTQGSVIFYRPPDHWKMLEFQDGGANRQNCAFGCKFILYVQKLVQPGNIGLGTGRKP